MLSVLSVGGRDKVLQAFENRNQLPANTKFAFIADLDLWVFGNLPDTFNSPNLLFSDGYSIENDAIRDGALMSLMTGVEAVNFEAEMDDICAWFSCAAKSNLLGGNETLKLHPNNVLTNGTLISECRSRVANDNDLSSFYNEIRSNPEKYLRGKTLLDLLMRQLSYPNRPARHHHSSLLDQVGANPGPIVQSLFDRIGLITAEP